MQIAARSLPRRFVPACCALALLAGCAANPDVKTSPSPSSRPDLLCNPAAWVVPFEKVGVPSSDEAVDVAVSGPWIYVLFKPARLLRVQRDGAAAKVEMTIGPAAASWSELAVDPADGSVWVSRDNRPAFDRFDQALRLTTVQLKRVEGESGFYHFAIGSDAIYAQPMGADFQLFRIDRSGKVLGTAFPAPAKPRPGEVADFSGCGVRVLNDRDGKVLAWDQCQGKVQEADSQGAWTDRPDITWPSEVNSKTRVVKGVDVGTRREAWYLSAGVGKLFYWKGRPLLLGPPVAGGRSGRAGTVLVVADRHGEERIESCHGAYLVAAASDAEGYAAITRNAVIAGSFATAPEPP